MPLRLPSNACNPPWAVHVIVCSRLHSCIKVKWNSAARVIVDCFFRALVTSLRALQESVERWRLFFHLSITCLRTSNRWVCIFSYDWVNRGLFPICFQWVECRVLRASKLFTCTGKLTTKSQRFCKFHFDFTVTGHFRPHTITQVALNFQILI